MRWSGSIAVAVLIVVAFAATPAPRYPDRPAPGHTGGFGEPTCVACHFDGQLNAPGGRIAMAGWPERPVPGRSYPIRVRLIAPDLQRAGFQLSVRTPTGAQAGRLAAIDDRSATTDTAGVTYAHHTGAGSYPGGPGTAEWRLQWTPSSDDPYRVHAAANAANGDASPLGDAIYARSLTVVRR